MKHPRLILLVIVLCIVSAGLAGALAWENVALRSSRPELARYREICGAVRSALYVDRARLRAKRMAWLDGFGKDRIGDGYQMLAWCLPRPFPMDAWNTCRADHDTACLDRLLRTAEDSIDPP